MDVRGCGVDVRASCSPLPESLKELVTEFFRVATQLSFR